MKNFEAADASLESPDEEEAGKPGEFHRKQVYNEEFDGAEDPTNEAADQISAGVYYSGNQYLAQLDPEMLKQLSNEQLQQLAQQPYMPFFSEQKFDEQYEGGEATDQNQVVTKVSKSVVLGGQSQKVQRVTKTVEVEYLCDETIEILVKDNHNLNEFSALVPFEKIYLPKLIQWIGKRRFQVVEQAREDTILLRVDMFSFELKLKHSGAELAAMLKELRNVRAERSTIMKDIKLFNYFFFNVYNEHDFKGTKNAGIFSKIPAA